jgi:uncharacterized protein with NAD-binding domain and iron-sulfur cluster
LRALLLGWRLGGKGASSRNPNWNNRIEEHGLHIWLGFYENAFAMMRTCYGNLHNRQGIFPSWTDAFKPHEYIVLQENTPQGWIPWIYNFPVNDSLPGSGFELPTPWDYLVMAIQSIRDAIEPQPVITPEQTLDHSVNVTSEAAMRKELSARERLSPGMRGDVLPENVETAALPIMIVRGGRCSPSNSSVNPASSRRCRTVDSCSFNFGGTATSPSRVVSGG